MPEPAKFSCRSCSTEIFYDVPDMETPSSFGNKVPCSNCGQVGCSYIAEPVEEKVEKTEYMQECLKNYFNDQFEIEQCLYLFSILISRGISGKFTENVKQTADNFIENGWIDEQGHILISVDEANRFVEDGIQEGALDVDEEHQETEEQTDDLQKLQPQQQTIKANDLLKASTGLVSGVDPLKEKREETVENKIRKRAMDLEISGGISEKLAKDQAILEFLNGDGYSWDEVNSIKSTFDP